MNLLVDIGNSRLKWALEIQGKLQTTTALSCEKENFKQQLAQAWEALENIEIVAISSVSSTEIVKYLTRLATQLWGQVKVVIAKSQSFSAGVTNSYQQADKLGVDRWLCLLAAHYYYPKVGWVIDCGTAITIDYIDETGLHKGGLISAGLGLMKKSLFSNTQALMLISGEHEFSLANNTQAAIYSGTLAASIGLIEQALKMQNTDRGILLTGGDAEIIYTYLTQTATLDTDLVLKGLSVYLQQEL